MKQAKKLILPLALTAALMAACGGERRPQGVMDEGRMADFLTEAYLIEAYHAVAQGYNYNLLPDSAQADYDHLLGRMALDSTQVEQSLAYYAQHPKQYAKIQERVQQRVDSVLAL